MSNDIKTQGLSGRAINVQKKALEKADINKSGRIDTPGEEFLFNYEIENSDVLKRSEKKIILGEKTPKAISENKQHRLDKRADKKDEKSSKEFFYNTLEGLAENRNISRKNIVQELKNILFNSNEIDAEEKYGNLIKVVEEIIKVMPEEYVDMNAIDSSKANIKAKLDENDKLHRTILRELSQVAKNEKIAEAQADITKRYADKVAEAEKNGEVKTDEAIMDEILSELRKEGKYIDETTQSADYQETYQNEYVEAYDSYINDSVMKNARILIAQVIKGESDFDQINGKKVHKEAIDFLKKNGIYDKYAKKANRQNRYGRKAANAQALENNVNLNTLKTQDELMKAFKGTDKEQLAKIKTLMSMQTTLLDEKGETKVDDKGEHIYYNLITENEDGTYDISVLSQLIGQSVGADNTLNKHKEAPQAELTLVMKDVAADKNTTAKLTEKEAMDLVKLCGYDIKGDGWNWLKAALGVTAGALTGGVVGAGSSLGTYISVAEDFKDINVEVNYKDKLNVDTLIEQMGEYNVAIEIITDGKIKISIKDLLANKQAFLALAPLAALDNALKGALLGGILGLLNGIQEHEEKPVVPIVTTATTLKEYSNELETNPKTAKYAPLLTAVAVAFGFVDENGGLDNKGLEIFLSRVVAGNDILNKQELLRIVEDAYMKENQHRLLTKPEKVETTPVEEETPVDSVEETPEIQASIIVEAKPEPVVVEKPQELTWTHEHTWQAIVMAYYPEALGNGSYKELKAAVDAFRDAHGISRQSGIPVGQKSQLVPIIIDGVEYRPDKNGGDNMDKALVKYGWQSEFFLQKWDVKPKEISRLTIKEYKDGEKTVYYGVRTNADGTTVKSGPLDSADAVIAELEPNASADADIKLTITVKDKDGKIEKQETKTIKKK